MIIRRANLEDHKELMFLYGEFLETDRFMNLNSDSFQKVIASKNNYILVGYDNFKVVGFITASIRIVVRYLQPIMQVDELYVDPDYRKNGLGRKLIKEIEIIATKNNCCRIYVESAYKHTLGHKFYEKNGYEKSGYYFRKVCRFT